MVFGLQIPNQQQHKKPDEKKQKERHKNCANTLDKQTSQRISPKIQSNQIIRYSIRCECECECVCIIIRAWTVNTEHSVCAVGIILGALQTCSIIIEFKLLEIEVQQPPSQLRSIHAYAIVYPLHCILLSYTTYITRLAIVTLLQSCTTITIFGVSTAHRCAFATTA